MNDFSHCSDFRGMWIVLSCVHHYTVNGVAKESIKEMVF